VPDNVSDVGQSKSAALCLLGVCQGHCVLCRTPERHSTRKLWKETVMTDEEQQEMPKAGLLMQAAEDGAYGC
jgi:hypothetical protein